MCHGDDIIGFDGQSTMNAVAVKSRYIYIYIYIYENERKEEEEHIIIKTSDWCNVYTPDELMYGARTDHNLPPLPSHDGLAMHL